MSPVSNVDFSLCRSGEAQGSHDGPMTRDTRIALFLIGELVAALRANDPDLFKRWLSELGGATWSPQADLQPSCGAPRDSEAKAHRMISP